MQPSLMEGVAQKLDSPMETKLAHAIGLMHFDSLHAEHELPRDLFVAVALCNQAQDLGFAFGCGAEAASGTLSFLSGKWRREMVRQRGVDVLLAVRGGSNRTKQLDVGALFQHITRCAGPQQLFQKRLVGMSSQTDNARLGRSSATCGWRRRHSCRALRGP